MLTTMFITRNTTSCSTIKLPSCRQDKLLQLSQVLSLRQELLRGREDNITSSFTSGLLATTHNGQRHRRRTSAVTIVLFRSLSTCISIFLYYCRHQIHDEAHCVLVLFDIQLCLLRSEQQIRSLVHRQLDASQVHCFETGSGNSKCR